VVIILKKQENLHIKQRKWPTSMTRTGGNGHWS
jgi:hypothetical protein